jgi:hypothetical protein
VPATLDQLRRGRAQLGLRVQGVLVGDRETMGLMEVCDDIHWVRDWRRYGARPETACAVGQHQRVAPAQAARLHRLDRRGLVDHALVVQQQERPGLGAA